MEQKPRLTEQIVLRPALEIGLGRMCKHGREGAAMEDIGSIKINKI